MNNIDIDKGIYFAGIDPSLTATAVAIIDKDGKLVRSHVISPKLTGPQRLMSIRDLLLSELCNLPLPAEFVCIEHYAMNCKFGRETAGELGGVLRVMMFENQFEYQEIPPLRLKQFATGKATAEKDHILMAVYKKWGIEFQKNDEADAFILAQMARAIYMVKNNADIQLTAYELEVIQNIINPGKKAKKKKLYNERQGAQKCNQN
jgi:crossover junction endodeoxyribonuclease RuvC